jgi:cytoskeleton protein RodZ
MAPPSLTSDRIRIGPSLEEARARAGLTIEEASERTKIRAKYLSALEAEDWDVLPSTAYAKGFLRTYARMLGLDADELVDAYRRVAGSEEPRLRPFGDRVLEERRRPMGIDDGRGRRGAILLVGGVLALAVVLALVIAGDLGDDSTHSRRDHAAGAGGGIHGQPAGAPSGPVTLRLHALRGAQLCLVGDGRALIDSQSLTPGTTAGPFHSRRFRLDLTSYGGGVLRLRLDGRPRKLRARGRSSYLIHRNGLKRTSYRGPGCP